MTVENMKKTTFNKADFKQWKEIAIQSLKGKPYESLIAKTWEGINLQPLYFEKTDYKKTNNENTTTIQSMKENRGWTIAQQTIADHASSFIAELKNSLDRGNESIVYDGSFSFDWEEDELLQLASLLSEYPVFFMNIKNDDPILRAFDFVHHEIRENVKGVVQSEDWIISVGYKNLRTIGADLWKVHHDGADAVLELAIALSEAARIAEGTESFQSFADNFFVRFAIDTHFFMEIAKLRAFRILWKAFSKAYEIDDAPYIPIMAVTSVRSYSKLDPYVNLLRAGNETFAAILGGSDFITVHPHDCLTGPNASSIRYARNIQLVLKEETHVEKVLDPAGGSYFIEELTDELVEKAWDLFLEIENKGGLDVFLQGGELKELLSKRQTEVNTGKRSLTGTNVYAELGTTNFDDWDGFKQLNRLAKPFEDFRKLASENQPKTVLVTFGELKNFKPRADFVTGFLASGGIKSEWSPSFQTAEQAIEWLNTAKPDYAIICATDEELSNIVESILEKMPEGLLLDVAGKVDKETERKWCAKGLNGTIFSGQNKIEKLHTIFDSWQGGATNDETRFQ
ncbi:methylmalonyl-CoA mutase family protein [Sporosarcina thermotolerans]|uniref:Methylmalonyl-CoA mutase family protein n=1 Tax=Sporosarcina thermotolerans TaxID=633404 RepID=A0AAW9A7X1_9BACL|nr:methylmalonyl-CoA mutase family protein [Sporosarcina thermotolerans]MDW0117292.1 methylmalonyl-CoA mutase family protein [Sporosarcina thermotolerans]WHT47449.1 methylmalonyl-CoA mutase family protein [Sporosarcina thermotolerans]